MMASIQTSKNNGSHLVTVAFCPSMLKVRSGYDTLTKLFQQCLKELKENESGN